MIDREWELIGSTPEGGQVRIVTRSRHITTFETPEGYVGPTPYLLDGFDWPTPEEEAGMPIVFGRTPQIPFYEAIKSGVEVSHLRPYCVFKGFDEVLEIEVKSFAPLP